MPDLTSSITVLMLWAVIGYAMGSVPFGVLVARYWGLGDLTKIGSGNIGATNVLRTGNKRAAATTLVLDGAKGAVAVLLARAMAGEDAAQVAALAALIGHCFPVWLGFKGGKGVASFLGIVLALYWPLGLLLCAVWLVVAKLSKYSSLAALIAVGLSPVLALVIGHGQVFVLCSLMAALVYWRHRGNIAQLRQGTETKIGAKS